MANEIKTVKVSDDNITFYTLPGSSAEINIESSSIDNSIYGQAYSSSLAGVFSYSLSANAWLRQSPGFMTSVKSTGVATVMTGEAMAIVSGKTYKIVDSAKEVWDYNATFVVYDGATDVTVNVESFDYLFGTVTFATTYTVVGAITVDGSFRSTSAFGCANSVDLSLSAEAVDSSCFETVFANGGYVTNEIGRKTVGVELSGLYRTANNFFNILESRSEIIVEIDFDGNGTTVARGYMRVTSFSESGDAGGQEEYSVSLELSVPDGEIIPFNFYFASGSLAPDGFKVIINSWLNATKMYFQYYPKGEANESFTGSVAVTDTSLSSSVDSITELSLSGDGDGALIEVI